MKQTILFLTLLFLCFTCMPPPMPNWYAGEPPLSIDTAAFRDKVIVIDPGHGGVYKGAVGKHGMTEKDINLRVAWQLYKKLEAVGAQPILTRSMEKDFLMDTMKVQDLKADLEERTRRANLCRTDLFVSIHHNASQNRNDNASKTFYYMDDLGPSYRLAQKIHAEFVRNLKIGQEELLPGNYFVLRHSKRPAVLGEPSYLSNPVQETILQLNAAVEVEAQAYFNGIGQFFSQGNPKIRDIQPAGKVFDYARPLLWARIDPGKTGMDEIGLSCWIDSIPVNAMLTGQNLVTVRPPQPLLDGWHTFAVALRARNGASCVTTLSNFKIFQAPAFMDVRAVPNRVASKGNKLVKTEAIVFNRQHGLVADSIPAFFWSSAGKWQHDTVFTQNGRVANYLVLKTARPCTVWIRCQALVGTVLLQPASYSTHWCGFAVDAVASEPIANAQMVSSQGIPTTTTDQFGFFAVPRFYNHPEIRKRGYVPIPIDTGRIHTKVHPVDQGALHRRRILIDPAYGGEESGPRSQQGLRASDLNMDLARKITDHLRLAGADVRYTRLGNKTQSLYQRIETSIRFDAEIVVSISYDSLPPHGNHLYHYPYSPKGKLLAENTANAITNIMGSTKLQGFSPRVNTILQQTPCPAMLVCPGSVRKPDTAYTTIGYLAYSVYRGIANYFQEKGKMLQIARLALPDSLMNTYPKVAVLDTYLSLPVTNNNTVIFHGLADTRHLLEVFHGNHRLLQAWVAPCKNHGLCFFE